MSIYLDEDDEPTITSGNLALDVDSIVAQVASDRDASSDETDDRTSYIGGSDAAVICGLSPWKSPLTLYQEKKGLIEPDDLSDNERVYWGTVLEEIVAREYSRRTGRKIRRVNRLIRHKEIPYIGAHIDRNVLNEPRILECKTADGRKAVDWGEEDSPEIPPYYYPQTQHYLYVTGDEVCDVAVLIGGNTYRLYQVPRDEEFIAGMVVLEQEFWDRIENDNPPPPETTDEARKLWARSHPGEIIATEGAVEAAERLAQVKHDMKGLEKEQEALELELMMQLGEEGDTLTYGGKTLATWKTQTSNRFDSKQFRQAHPDLYEAFKRPSESRVFRLKTKVEG